MRLPSSCWRLDKHKVSQNLQLDLCSDYRDLDVSMMMMCYIDKITLLLLINFYYGISMLKSGNISNLMLS